MSFREDDRSPLELELARVLAPPDALSSRPIRSERILELAAKKISAQDGRRIPDSVEQRRSRRYRASLIPAMIVGAIALVLTGAIGLSAVRGPGATNVPVAQVTVSPSEDRSGGASVAPNAMSHAKSYSSVKELGSYADLVVVGRVSAALLVPAGPDRMNTRVTFEVDQTLKGASPGNQITILQRGAKIDGSWTSEEGSRLQVGDHALLFLVATEPQTGPSWEVFDGVAGQFGVAGDTVSASPWGSSVPIPDGLTISRVAALLNP